VAARRHGMSTTAHDVTNLMDLECYSVFGSQIDLVRHEFIRRFSRNRPVLRPNPPIDVGFEEVLHGMSS
jgi:hypothetical protein